MINWNLPDNDAEGFLRRKREIADLLDLPPTPKNLDKILDYLIPFVEGTKKEAREALLDASKNEYGKGVAHLLGYAQSVPDPKGGKSVPQ